MRLEIIGWNEEKGRWSGVTFFIDNVCIMCLMWECVCVLCVFEKNLLFYPCVPKTMIKWEKWSRGLLNGIFFFFIANKIVCVFLSCMVYWELGARVDGYTELNLFQFFFFLFLYIVKLVYSNIHKMRRGWEKVEKWNEGERFFFIF